MKLRHGHCSRRLIGAIVILALLPLPAQGASFRDFLKKKSEQLQEAVLDGIDNVAKDEDEVAEPIPEPTAGPAADHHPQQVRRIQHLLTELGYQPGPVDGAFGPGTARAIRQYETDQGLPPTGVPSAELSAHMARTWTESRKTAPAAAPAVASSPSASESSAGTEPATPDAPESLVAPAPAGATPTAAATAPPGAQGTDTAAQSPAAAMAAAAGLRIVRGRPLLIKEGWVGSAEREIISDQEIAATRRFLDHIRIGLNPDIAKSSAAGTSPPAASVPAGVDPSALGQDWSRDARARCIANRLLDDAAKNEILQQAVDPRSGRDRERAWQGEQVTGGPSGNEFEQRRAKERFDELLPGLVASAPQLPMKFVLVDRVLIRPYDHANGGFPLESPQVRLPKSDCLAIDSDYLPLDTELPSLLAVDAAAAERLMQRIPVAHGHFEERRTAFMAIDLTLSGAPQSPIAGKLRGEQLVPMKIEIESIALYEDPDLERHLHTFGVDRPAPSVLLAGVPEQVPMPDPLLGPDTVALLLLKTQGDVLSTEAWNQLARIHSDADKRYYAKERRRSIGGGTLVETLDTYDPAYVPFFPPGVTLEHHRSLAPEQLATFKAWSLARAQKLPEQFVLQSTLVRVDGGNGPDRPRLRFSQTDRSPSIDRQAILSRGASEQQIEFPELDDHPHYLAGPAGRRETVLLFPNAVDRYLPAVTLDELTAMTPGNRWSWTVEMDVRVPAVDVVTGGAGAGPYGRTVSEALLLQIEPVAMRVLHRPHQPEMTGRVGSAIATLHEQRYEVEALDPGRKEDWDVIGIRLGMPLEEADALVRRQLDVARTYDRRKRDDALGHGYAWSRVYFGTRQNEVVALYAGEAEPRSVQAVFRRVPLERVEIPQEDRRTERDPVYKALTEKYGQDASYALYHLYWGGTADRNPCTSFRASSLGTSESTLQAGTADTRDRGLLSQIDFGLYDRIAVAGTATPGRPASAWTNCNPVVVARPSGVELDVWLFDHSRTASEAERGYRAHLERAAEQRRSAAADIEL